MSGPWESPMMKERSPQEFEDRVRGEWVKSLEGRPIGEAIKILQDHAPFVAKDHMEAIISDVVLECRPQDDEKFYKNLDVESLRYVEVWG